MLIAYRGREAARGGPPAAVGGMGGMRDRLGDATAGGRTTVPPASTVTQDNGAASEHAASTAGLGPTTFPRVPVAPATPFLLGAADISPAMEPATVLGNMRIAILQYGSRFGGNPVGSNSEITKALDGENPKQVRFLSEESGLRINARSELVDYWGTPFFFHQLSGTEMEIRSAGPDRIMWTADDLVTK
jgi:hypothetical protein